MYDALCTLVIRTISTPASDGVHGSKKRCLLIASSDTDPRYRSLHGIFGDQI